MGSFAEHIIQAKSNLRFVTEVNSRIPGQWDWQVTACFYTAVHLVNAHIAVIANLHYRSHEEVKRAIYHHNSTSMCTVPESIYLAYVKLEGLARRARYLVHDDPAKKEETAHLTHDKHFAKAVKNLDRILVYFRDTYTIDFGSPTVKCLDLGSNSQLAIFKFRD